MITIKILGSGCANCQKVETNTREAVADLDIAAEVVHVTQPAQIHAYPILATPGLVINEKLVSAGRIPTKDEIVAWIQKAI